MRYGCDAVIEDSTPIPGWKPAYLLLIDRARALVERLRYNKVAMNGFRIARFEGGSTVYLQHWQVLDRKMEKGRKWVLSPHMVDSEIVQTALMAILAFEEHEAREALTFDGRRIYGPHRSLVDLDKEIECRVEESKPEAEQQVEETGPGIHGSGTDGLCPEKIDPWVEQRRKDADKYWKRSPYKPLGFGPYSSTLDPFGADDPRKF